jgi:hypothetical protein
MRRESSTIVCLVGDVTGDVLAGLTRSPNVSVARPAEDPAAAHLADPLSPARSSVASAATAMREAARQRGMYVIVPADPLADVAAAWQQMWQPAAASAGAVGFESSAAEALAAWRDRRFELPDYYLVMAPAQGDATAPDLYLGPLRAVRPRRVAVAVVDTAPHADSLLDALRSLEQGPWWPPLDELLEAARRFYAGGLAETQQLTT